MKRIVSAIVLSVLLGAMVAPAVVSAQTQMPETCDASKANQKLDECNAVADTCSTVEGATGYHANCGFCCMMNTIYKITDWLFIILILFVTIMIIYGGFTIVTASGDPEKAGKGKQILTYAIIGLAIALLAKVIPSIVRFVIGV